MWLNGSPEDDGGPKAEAGNTKLKGPRPWEAQRKQQARRHTQSTARHRGTLNKCSSLCARCQTTTDFGIAATWQTQETSLNNHIGHRPKESFSTWPDPVAHHEVSTFQPLTPLGAGLSERSRLQYLEGTGQSSGQLVVHCKGGHSEAEDRRDPILHKGLAKPIDFFGS